VPGDRYDILAYWGSRQESAAACAARLAMTLVSLANIDPVYGRWFHQAWTEEDANVPLCTIPPDLNALTAIVDEGKQYFDRPRKVWPQLGFSVSAWNGRDNPFGAAFSIGCGAYQSSLPMVNRVSLAITEKRLATLAPWTEGAIREVLLAIIKAWDVEFAVVANDKLCDMLPLNKNDHWIWPWGGWLTYLASPWSALVHPPEPVNTERFPDGGMLATLSDQLFDADDPRHRELLMDMQRALAPVQKIWDPTPR
jgi:hypothetical protein